MRSVPALLFAVGIFYGGMMDVGPLPQTPGVPADKLLHAAAFFVFEWLVELALLDMRARYRRPLAIWIAASAGFLLEGVQAALPHRSAELWDGIADAIGALLGGASLWLLGRWRRPWRRSES